MRDRRSGVYDPMQNDDDDPTPARSRRPERRSVDVNEMPVWTWVAILLIVVVIGGALWLMSRSDDRSSATDPVTAQAVGGAPQAATALPAAAGGVTPTPVILGNTPTPPPPDKIDVGVKAAITGTGASQLRVRSGPSTEFATLVIIPDGTEVRVIEGPEEHGGLRWWRIELTDGNIGWTVEAYLKPISG